MDQIFNLLGVGLTWVVAIIGGLLAAFWVGLIIWTWRDIRARSSDIFAALLAALLVAIFNVVGLLIYILVRPKHTLAEQYDRALEEEILLRELEQAPTCYNCGRPVQPDWQYCPYCEAELKHPCPQCGYLLQPEWKRCPKCGAPAEDFTSKAPASVAPVSPPRPEPVSIQPETIALPDSGSTPVLEPELVIEEAPLRETATLPEAEAVARAEALKREGVQDED